MSCNRFFSLVTILLLLCSLPVLAQNTKPVKTSPTLTKSEVPPPSNYVSSPAPSSPSTHVLAPKPEFIWWKDFPWVTLGGICVVIAALIQRKTSEDKRRSDEEEGQKKRQLDKELAEARLVQDKYESEQKRLHDRVLADEKLKRDEEAAEKRLKQERLHFEHKELQEQFADIQNRLASPEPSIRANAALRLGMFATTIAPGLEKGAPRIEENNPYFLPAASQLATALTLEENPAIRKAILDALKRMDEFAKPEPGQQLLHELIERLADANRTAKDAFIVAIGEWVSGNPDWEEAETRFIDNQGRTVEDDLFDLLSSIAAFSSEKEKTQICLDDLMSEDRVSEKFRVKIPGKYDKHREIYRAKLRYLSEEEKAKAVALLLPRLETTAHQLRDTRDALSRALNALEAVGIEFPKNWTRPKPLSLHSCFLAGNYFDSDLSNTHLQGADLSFAYLQGANIAGAHWEQAKLYKAKLQSSHLEGTKLQGANLAVAQMQNANLSWAKLQGAHLESAQLQGTILREAKLQEASLISAQVKAADFSKTQLQATKLGGLYVQEEVSDKLPRTNFDDANWKEADFDTQIYCNDEVTERTQRLQEWLKENFWYETEEEKQARIASENGKVEEIPVAPVPLNAKTKRQKNPPL